MVPNIYSFLRTLVYLVYCVVTFIKRVLVRLRKSCLELSYKCDSLKNELCFISRESKLFNKTPCHVVIILGNESISYKDLANITIWCLAARISFVSLYDYTGKLKKNEAELFKVLTDMNKGHLENIVWGKKTLTNGISNKNGMKNGISSKKIQVNIFSHADGKDTIVRTTKKLCQSILDNELKSSEVTVNFLDEMLHKELGLPDPDLAICCGPILSTYGLLPWQIRVTEFLQLPTHHSVNVRDFVDLLHVYSQSEQRLGK